MKAPEARARVLENEAEEAGREPQPPDHSGDARAEPPQQPCDPLHHTAASLAPSGTFKPRRRRPAAIAGGRIPAARGAGVAAVPAQQHSEAGALRRLRCARCAAQRFGAACSLLMLPASLPQWGAQAPWCRRPAAIAGGRIPAARGPCSLLMPPPPQKGLRADPWPGSGTQPDRPPRRRRTGVRTFLRTRGSPRACPGQ